MSPNPPHISVRPAQLNDLAELVDLLSDSFYSRTGVMQWFLPLLRLGVYEDLRYRLRSSLPSDYVCLVAFVLVSSRDQPDLAGTVEMSLRSATPFQFRNLPHPYLSNLAVRLDARRQGVAQKLLTACERAALDLGFEDLYLHVLEDNYRARQLYAKAGYQTQQENSFWQCWFWRQPRKLLLHKRLSRFSQ